MIITKYKSIIKLFIIATICISGVSFVTAQDNTLYFMNNIPQTMSINPAIHPTCKGYGKIPVLADIKLGVSNSGFVYDDLKSFDKILSKLKDKNYLSTDIKTNLLGFGFEIDKFYFTFDMSANANVNVMYPKALVALKDGNYDWINEQAINHNFDGLGINATTYTEIALGASYKLFDNLTIGAKLKYLSGIANATTLDSKLNWQTDNDTYEYTLNSDIEFNASYPIEIEMVDGFPEIKDEEEDKDVMTFIKEEYLFNKNNGFGIDLGVTYKFNDQITFYGSITDIGFIKWKNNTNTLTSKTSFPFKGADIEAATDGDRDLLEEITDSLTNSFAIKHSLSSYKTNLSTKIYIGGNYILNENFNFGALTRFQIFDKRIRPSLTLSANTNVGRWLTASLTYSMMNNTFNNIGLGFAVGGGPVQFYFVTDNASSALWPKKTKNVTVRFGINLLFGCKLQKDESLDDDDDSGIY